MNDKINIDNLGFTPLDSNEIFLECPKLKELFSSFSDAEFHIKSVQQKEELGEGFLRLEGAFCVSHTNEISDFIIKTNNHLTNTETTMLPRATDSAIWGDYQQHNELTSSSLNEIKEQFTEILQDLSKINGIKATKPVIDSQNLLDKKIDKINNRRSQINQPFPPPSDAYKEAINPRRKMH